MRVAIMKPLFDWESLEDSPSLSSVRFLLQTIPDAKLLQCLEQARGKGRDDYPCHVLWGVVLLTMILRHPSFEACLGDLRRNAQLRRLIGIESESAVPKKWNISRFLRRLGQPMALLLMREAFDQMSRRLSECVPDLGAKTAGDATQLNARRARDKEGAAEEEAQGLPEASCGKKEYTDDDGKVTKVLEWFGYKLHLIVDVKHEVALGYKVTASGVGDGQTLPEVLAQAQGNLPERRMQTLAYDKAADAYEVHAALERAGVKPVIQTRKLWKEEQERMLAGHDGTSNVVYDEAGTIYCYDRVSDPPVRRRMSYMGYEQYRGTLKYRCPAAHEGWQCPSAGLCNAGKSFGKIVRVEKDVDLRRFPPVPRATKQFERLYRGRTAVERVNARLKVFWGADDGNISGARRFHGFIGALMLVHSAFATALAAAPRYEGTLGKMRLSPIAQAIRAKLAC
jgi:hypothetical protein